MKVAIFMNKKSVYDNVDTVTTEGIRYSGQKIKRSKDALITNPDNEFYIFRREKSSGVFTFYGIASKTVIVSERTFESPPVVLFKIEDKKSVKVPSDDTDRLKYKAGCTKFLRETFDLSLVKNDLIEGIIEMK